MSPDELAEKVAQLEKQLSVLNSTLPQSIKEWKANEQHAGELIQKIEQAQRKADDEALRAYNAKVACEEHAKFTTATRGQVEVELAAITAAKAKSEETASALNSIRANGEEVAKSIPASQEALSKAQAWVSQNLPQLESNAQAAANAKKAIDTLAHESTTERAEIKTAYSEVVGNKGQIASLLSEVTKLKGEAATAASKAEELKTEVENDRATSAKRLEELRTVADELDRRHDEIKIFRGELEKLIGDNTDLNVKAEELLPHAASAGLASAFRTQKERFKSPQRWWLFGFVSAILALLAIAAPEFFREILAKTSTNSAPITWDSILINFVHRLPVILPLVWLAIYAGRNYTMAIRMEEDYAFKEAVSTAFEGYKREMTAISSAHESEGDSPLIHLCAQVLNCFSQRPGRIYEGKHHDVTPFTPVVNAAAEAIKASKVANE